MFVTNYKYMKKYILILLLIPAFAFSQQALNVKQWQVNAGLGFSNWGLPIYGGFDYMFHKDMSLGAQGELRLWNSAMAIGASGNWNYHFNRLAQIPNNWDLYAGLNVGFYSWMNGLTGTGLGLGLQIGGRYYFTKAIGVNLELGGGVGNGGGAGGGRLGVSFRL